MEIKQRYTLVKIPENRKEFDGMKIGEGTYLSAKIGGKPGQLHTIPTVEAKTDAKTFEKLLHAAWNTIQPWDPNAVYTTQEARDAAWTAYATKKARMAQLGAIRDNSVWDSARERDLVIRKQERAREKMRRGRRK